ncbi:DUF2116 family Zn-ribbon domain-containing protein [Caldibacillus thermoamylovorans]|uniref:DUF2116 family Zn-ribbon domain-containing protein n=1 Tax=Caldibacillus thermoamylovorans TaxID=35841 RepID=UPI00203ECCC3|nr:DUF2116 family Zn-ribbon domain-containing protein [Caldibacillus thermoamylovorans]MCM3800048.1 DUF2116 family Zn-ribbon domain-containing protein [Caldibacillus thermoamylovorans]
MHKLFNFPIDCFSPQVPLNKPEIIETDLGLYIYDRNPDVLNAYEAFDTIEIIPSLINLVEKIERTGESWSYWSESNANIKLAINWMKKWGHLKAEKGPNNQFYGERISGFFQESIKFYKLWELYKAVANRDLPTLKKITEVYDGDLEDQIRIAEDQLVFCFWGDEFFRGEVISSYDEKNLLKSYQYAAITYLGDVIETYINNSHLYSGKIEITKSQEKDIIKFKPELAFFSLLEVVYMQFYILLSENTKKICPICNKPFLPERQDKKYCSDTCKHTAKSRRYRARKSQII